MLRPLETRKAYTPEQIAELLQISKNTVYELISRGEIVAKKFGKLYRISPTSVSFLFTGLDYDLYKAEQEDIRNLEKYNIQSELKKVRSSLK